MCPTMTMKHYLPAKICLWLTAFTLLLVSMGLQAANTQWTSVNPTPQFNELQDILWDGNRYTAVGSSGVILTSSDGVNWSSQSIDVLHQLYGITWNGSTTNPQYVISGDRGLLITSPDGNTWTFRNTGVRAEALFSVAWSPGLSLYVTVGANGVLLTSPDGITWTRQNSGTGAMLRRVVWSDDLQQFVAVGSSGLVITSVDGVTWTIRYQDEPSLILRGLVWNAVRQEYVTVGTGGTVLTSKNGFTWRTPTNLNPDPTTQQTLYAIAWDGTNNQYVSVGSNGFLMTSPDAETWTARVTNVTSQLQGAAWNGTSGLVIVVGKETLLSSGDGITWNALSNDVTQTAANLNGVAWGSNTFVAVGDGGTVVSSPDGAAWTDRTAASGTVLNLNAVAAAFLNNIAVFAAVGDGGTVITSPDGANWNDQTGNSSTTQHLNAVTSGNNRFVAVGDGGTVITSNDGTTWTPGVSNTPARLTAAAWDNGNGLFVAVGDGGTILTSPDGASWIPPTTLPWSNNFPPQDLSGIITGGKEIVAVGAGGTIITSTDGLNWKAVASGTTLNFHAIRWNGVQYLVLADDGIVLSSLDASDRSFILFPQVTDQALRAAAWNTEIFVAVGDSATILSSGQADLAISAAVTPDPATQNKILSLATTISNTSALYTDKVTWSYILPSSVTFDAATPSQGSCSFALNTVSCDLGAVVAGAEAVSVIVDVIPSQPGTITNTATVFANRDINTSNNSASVDSLVNEAPPNLEDPDNGNRKNGGLGATHAGLLLLLLGALGWRLRKG